jgi:DivIVA domain-containing protein
MYNENLYLTPQDILDKEFKVDTKGYSMKEVDKFLDMVIRDYTSFTNIIKKLQIEKNQLASDNEKLKAEYRKLKGIIDSANAAGGSSAQPAYNNIDLLKRISALEKTVYGKED